MNRMYNNVWLIFNIITLNMAIKNQVNFDYEWIISGRRGTGSKCRICSSRSKNSRIREVLSDRNSIKVDCDYSKRCS